MIFEIVLSCIGAYVVIAGLVIVFRRDAIWAYTQERRMGVGRGAAERTPQWDAAMIVIGLAAAVVGAGVLAGLWVL